MRSAGAPDTEIQDAIISALGRMNAIETLENFLDRYIDETRFAETDFVVTGALPYLPEESATRLRRRLAHFGITVTVTPDDPFASAGPLVERFQRQITRNGRTVTLMSHDPFASASQSVAELDAQLASANLGIGSVPLKHLGREPIGRPCVGCSICSSTMTSP